MFDHQRNGQAKETHSFKHEGIERGAISHQFVYEGHFQNSEAHRYFGPSFVLPNPSSSAVAMCFVHTMTSKWD
jgi:hypothetical protein